MGDESLAEGIRGLKFGEWKDVVDFGGVQFIRFFRRSDDGTVDKPMCTLESGPGHMLSSV
jgi:hypothetical protein